MVLERRMHPRYRTSWMVEIGRGDNDWFEATLSDVSLASFALSTSRDAVVSLAGGGGMVLPGDLLHLRFIEGIDWPTDCASFACLVRQVRRVSQANYFIGGEFGALTAAQNAALAQGIKILASRVAS